MRSPVGDLIIEAMVKENLRQSQVCTKTRIPPCTLCNIISGNRTLSWETALNLESALEFFDGEKAISDQYRFLKQKRANEISETH